MEIKFNRLAINFKRTDLALVVLDGLGESDFHLGGESLDISCHGVVRILGGLFAVLEVAGLKLYTEET